MNRKKFLQALPVLFSLPVIVYACKHTDHLTKGDLDQQVGGRCEDCEILFVDMPNDIAGTARIANDQEHGEQIEISGVVYQNDGLTPAKDVIVYVYHTNAAGYYAPADHQNPASKKHGRCRGWIKTTGNGQYSFQTIKPGIYPDRTMPAHIHPIIKEPGKSVYYADDYVFTGEYKVDETYISKQEKRCGSGIIAIKKNKAGIWMGTRDIILGLNIPDYNPQVHSEF